MHQAGVFGSTALVAVAVSCVADESGTAAKKTEPAESVFLERIFRDDSGEHKYALFVPADYSNDKKWPVILFLHGAGVSCPQFLYHPL